MFKNERVLSVALVGGEKGILLAVGLEVCLTKSLPLPTLGHGLTQPSSGQTNKVQVFTLSPTEVPAEPDVTFTDNRNPVHALAFTPDGTLLAAGESSGKIQVYDVIEKKVRSGNHPALFPALR